MSGSGRKSGPLRLFWGFTSHIGSIERICVMMSAMNPSCLPPAILRSGRVELWLETRLPDAPAREQILRDRLDGLEAFAALDLRRIAESAGGLTGADLKSVVEDAKLLYARDVKAAAPLRPIESYFDRAIEDIRANHREKPRIGFAAR